MQNIARTCIFYATVLAFLAGGMPRGASAEGPGPGAWRHVRRQAPQTYIESIFAAGSGDVWVGAGESMHVYDGVRWRRVQLDGTDIDSKSPFMMDAAGRFYFIDDNELVIWNGDRAERHGETKVGYPAVGARSPDGILYLASWSTVSGGLFAFDGDTVSKMMDGRIRSVAVDDTGALWLTLLDSETGRMRLVRREDGTMTDLTADIDYLFPVTTNELTVQKAPNGDLWVVNLGKYGVFSDGSWTFHDGGGAPVFLQFDRNGGVWGYGYKTLYRLGGDGDWIESFLMAAGTTHAPKFIASDPGGAVWTFDGDRVYRWNGVDAWEEIVSHLDLASDRVTSLEYTEDGTLILAHGVRDLPTADRLDQGISIRPDSEWRHYNRAEDVELLNVYQLKRTPDGDVMSYTDGGFKFYTDETWILVDSLFVNNQTDMDWDDTIMWITTRRGLIEYVDGPEFEFYLPMDGGIAYALDNLFVNDDGVKFMQTPKRDIIRWDGTEWRTVVRDNGFTNDFTIDDDGVVWGARSTGLAIWNESESSWDYLADIDDCRVVEIDPDGRVWAAATGEIGWYSGNAWHPVEELSGYTADDFAFAPDGRIAMNLFDDSLDRYYGVYEFQPSTAVEGPGPEPREFIACSSHPNPFNPMTTITFDLPEAAHVTVDIYAVNGQRVARIADETHAAGRNSVVWHAGSDGSVGSGIYFYRIAAGKRTGTGKMLLVR